MGSATADRFFSKNWRVKVCGGGIFAMARRLIDIGASQLLLDPSIVCSGLLKYAHNVRFEHNSKVEAACECFLVTGTEWAESDFDSHSKDGSSKMKSFVRRFHVGPRQIVHLW